MIIINAASNFPVHPLPPKAKKGNRTGKFNIEYHIIIFDMMTMFSGIFFTNEMQIMKNAKHDKIHIFKNDKNICPSKL